MKSRRHLLFSILALSALASIIISACAPVAIPTSAPAPTSAAQPTSAPAPTNAPAPTTATQPTTAPTAASQPTTAATSAPGGATTLQVWWVTSSPEYSKALRAIFDQYEQAHPGIKINSTFYSYNDMVAAGAPALQSGNPPDIMFTDPSPPVIPNYIKAGYLVDLTDIAAQKKWADRLAPGMLTFYGPIHDNKIYGAPISPAVRGFFYNKDIMKAIGGSEPKTFDELLALADKAKAAGYIPFGLGNNTSWSSEYYWLNPTYLRWANEDWQKIVADNMTCKPGVPWGGEDVRQSLTDLVKWEKAGYFNPGYQGIGETDVHLEFAKGKMLMYFYNAASQNVALKADNPPFEIGFFNFPPIYPDKPLLSMSDPGNLMVIPKDAKNQAQALDFMDWMLSPEVEQTLAADGIIPAHKADYSKVNLPVPWMQAELDQLSKQTAISWQNWLVPGFGDVTGPEVQSLLAGEKSVDDVLKVFEAKYKEGCKL
ncbi:MAG TPA: ABC transporter substrate-binding protein [Anaerolineae bacterium]|nr:ABC transporter substrate-binding protein [Anaerolineae bacterium]